MAVTLALALVSAPPSPPSPPPLPHPLPQPVQVVIPSVRSRHLEGVDVARVVGV
jgi:hypothetical protein